MDSNLLPIDRVLAIYASGEARRGGNFVHVQQLIRC